MSARPDQDLRQTVNHLQSAVADLSSRVDELETEKEQLEDELEAERRERESLENLVDAINRRVSTNLDRLLEIQSRELEKGAWLDADHVRGLEEKLDVGTGEIEYLTGPEGDERARVPGHDDPLEDDGPTLATSDLLPVQQVARLDDEILEQQPKPVQAAAKLWRAREQDDIHPWSKGSKEVREYVDAGEIRDFIRAEFDDVSPDYAKKLTSRAIDRLLEFTHHRVYIEKRNHRKDGLSYKERRVVLPVESDIPGEHHEVPTAEDDPGTAVVHGD